jgi:hypothetical protein
MPDWKATSQDYTIAGLAVSSEIPLPGLIERPPANAPADIEIRLERVPARLDEAVARGPNWEMAADLFLLRVPNVARFLMCGGRRIAVDAVPGGCRDAAIFLVGTVFGILLHQRGRMALHASAIAVGGQAVLFCGPSGAGKSTLAAALGNAGYPLLSDDLCAVDVQDRSRPLVYPDGRQLKLWDESVAALGLRRLAGSTVRSGIQKYYVAPQLASVCEPLPILAIYSLCADHRCSNWVIDELHGMAAATSIRDNAYRPYLIAEMSQAPLYFSGSTALVKSARIYSLTRALDLSALAEGVRCLEAHWQTGEKKDAGN